MTVTQTIGASIKRREDFRFIKGLGKYTADIKLPGQTYCYILMIFGGPCPYRVHRYGCQPKLPRALWRSTPAADLDASGVGGLPCGWQYRADGTPMKEPPHPVLASGKVRHVGDPVAL